MLILLLLFSFLSVLLNAFAKVELSHATLTHLLPYCFIYTTEILFIYFFFKSAIVNSLNLCFEIIKEWNRSRIIKQKKLFSWLFIQIASGKERCNIIIPHLVIATGVLFLFFKNSIRLLFFSPNENKRETHHLKQQQTLRGVNKWNFCFSTKRRQDIKVSSLSIEFLCSIFRAW